MSRTRQVFTATCVLCAFGSTQACDSEPLVDADFVGEAMFTVPLLVGTRDPEAYEGLAHPRWGLFRVRGGLDGGICDVEAVPDVGLPAELGETELNLFAPIDDADLETTDGGGRYAIVRPVGFDDLNDDGVKDADEPFRADTTEGLFYTPDPMDADQSPSGVAVAAGYHRFLLDGSCNPIPRGDDEDDCDVPLGAACEDDSQCGTGGLCMTEQPQPGWPGGYCTLSASEDGCQPANGRLYAKARPGGGGDEVWLKVCERDADCRDGEGYYCQPLLGACFPLQPLRVEFFRGPKKAACTPYFIGATGGAPMGGDDGMGMGPGDMSQMPPEDCEPSDPRCDGIPGGGGMPGPPPADQCGDGQ